MIPCTATRLPDTVLEAAGCDVRAIHDTPALFGGGLPDPSESARAAHGPRPNRLPDTGLANDGDSDRFGIIDFEGDIAPCDFISLVTDHHLRDARVAPGAKVVELSLQPASSMP